MTEKANSLAEAVRQARQEKGWRQDELAARSGVSLRTISMIEGGAHKPRAQAVVQLADAFLLNPKPWLELANLSSEAIVHTSSNRFPGEIDPSVYFAGLLSSLPQSKPNLVMPCYTSSPGTLQREDIFEQLRELVNGGTWFAMVFPYPEIRDHSDPRMTHLRLFYQGVFTQMRILAETLRAAVETDARERINIFVSQMKGDGDALPIVMPPIGLGDSRPCFIKFTTPPEDRFNEELAAWVRVVGQDKDRWIPIYPDQGLGSRGAQNIQAFYCWRDYFSEIIEQWDNHKSNDNRGWLSGTYRDWRPILGNDNLQ